MSLPAVIAILVLDVVPLGLVLLLFRRPDRILPAGVGAPRPATISTDAPWAMIAAAAPEPVPVPVPVAVAVAEPPRSAPAVPTPPVAPPPVPHPAPPAARRTWVWGVVAAVGLGAVIAVVLARR